MVKLTSIQLFKYAGPDKDPFILGSAADLTAFGYFQRCELPVAGQRRRPLTVLTFALGSHL
jgi:hypothetical protein